MIRNNVPIVRPKNQMKRGIYYTGILSLSLAVLLFCSSRYFQSQKEITRIVLKKDNFPLTNQVYDFRFAVPRSVEFNVVLRFMGSQDERFSLFNGSVKYRIRTGISANGHSIENKFFDQSTGGVRHAGSKDATSWYPLTWKADKDTEYDLRISFESDDDRFNGLQKEILIESDYDPAAMPFIYLLEFITKWLSIVAAALGVVLFILLWLRGKKKT